MLPCSQQASEAAKQTIKKQALSKLKGKPVTLQARQVGRAGGQAGKQASRQAGKQAGRKLSVGSPDG